MMIKGFLERKFEPPAPFRQGGRGLPEPQRARAVGMSGTWAMYIFGVIQFV